MFDLRFQLECFPGALVTWSRTAVEFKCPSFDETSCPCLFNALKQVFFYFYFLPAFTDPHAADKRDQDGHGVGVDQRARSSKLSSVLREFHFLFMFVHSHSFKKALLSLVKRHGDVDSALDEHPQAEVDIKTGVRLAISRRHSTDRHWPTDNFPVPRIVSDKLSTKNAHHDECGRRNPFENEQYP